MVISMVNNCIDSIIALKKLIALNTFQDIFGCVSGSLMLHILIKIKYLYTHI